MQNELNKILNNIMNCTSMTNINRVLEEATNLINSGVLSTEESIELAVKIIEIKTKLGILKPEKNYSLLDIQKVVQNQVNIRNGDMGFISFIQDDLNDPIKEISEGYGLFSENGSFSIVSCYKKMEECSEIVYSFGRQYRYVKYQVVGTDIFDATHERQIASIDTPDYLKNNVEKICLIENTRVYPVALEKIILTDHIFYYVKDLEKLLRVINNYLLENPDFIPSMFEQAEEHQIKLNRTKK